MEVFQDYAYYYNAFYNEKNYKNEAEQIDQLLKKYGIGGKRLLNLGCGTGRHDIELAQMGYQCTGIDMSSCMIDIARHTAKIAQVQIDYDIADIRQYESREMQDAVISLFHVMSYQTGNADILKAFFSARKALTVGGIFLFDVWYGPGVLSDKPTVRVKETEDNINRLIRIANPIMHDKQNVVDVCYEVFVINKKSGITKTIKETHHMRYFFKPELEILLNKAGFELIDNLDCQSLGETDYSSWTSYFIAKVVL